MAPPPLAGSLESFCLESVGPVGRWVFWILNVKMSTCNNTSDKAGKEENHQKSCIYHAVSRAVDNISAFGYEREREKKYDHKECLHRP